MGTVAPGEAIEAEPFSDLEDDESFWSDLTSLKSSVLAYEYENGRRYHAYQAGKYLLPNDDTEQERLELLHHVFRLTLGGALCRTTLETPQKILDIGTGTGIWAIEIGDEYPSAEVIGTDLSPIQPSWLPPNVRFQVDDATQEWAFPENSFDFIHIRGMSGSIRDWPALMRQCYKHLRTGGKIEISEGRTNIYCNDGSYPADCQTRRWVTEFHRLAATIGLDFDSFPQYHAILDSVGFKSIQPHEELVPIGHWPKDKRLKEIGTCFREQMLEGAIDSYSLAMFTRVGKWSEEETKDMLRLVRSEIMSNKMHIYTHCSYITAEKPTASRH